MVIHLDNMTRTVGLLKRPDGSKQFPARSCCDLKEQHSESESGGYFYITINFKLLVNSQFCLLLGLYWIDPNGGCPVDAFQVHCDFEDGSCATCIDAKEWVSAESGGDFFNG